MKNKNELFWAEELVLVNPINIKDASIALLLIGITCGKACDVFPEVVGLWKEKDCTKDIMALICEMVKKGKKELINFQMIVQIHAIELMKRKFEDHEAEIFIKNKNQVKEIKQQKLELEKLICYFSLKNKEDNKNVNLWEKILKEDINP